MALGALAGVGPDDEVEKTGEPLRVRAGEALLGRVIHGLGRPIDGGGAITARRALVAGRSPPPGALERRRPITRANPVTGIRVLDGLLTIGEGQRVGLFAGSGVGKSTLLGAIARGVEADAVVVALVGERGREVGEFLEHALGREGRAKSVVGVVATSDAPPLERLRAAQGRDRVRGGGFRDARGSGGHAPRRLRDALRARQREVGLAAGEPPRAAGALRASSPSFRAACSRALGARARPRSITAIYAVLVEGQRHGRAGRRRDRAASSTGTSSSTGRPRRAGAIRRWT